MGNHGWWGIGVRRVSRWTALLIAFGAIVSALPIVHVPWSLAAVLGYADFGYVPANCGRPTSSVQALNGDVIHVCQDDQPATGAFFAGHSIYPSAGGGTSMSRSGPALMLDLPDPKLSFSCCASGSNGSGTYLSFTPVAFGPVTTGSLLSGTLHYSAAYNGTTYATVDQTASVAAGASSYQITFAITNTSGAPLKLRPIASMDYYGHFWSPPEDLPVWSTSAPPLSLTERNPVAGGALTVTSSGAAGSPAISGYTAGSGQRVSGELAPGGTLDNVLHGPDGNEPVGSSTMAVEWDDHRTVPLAAGATARYSLDVGIQQTRDLRLALHGAAPAADAPTTLDAWVTDDRSLSGRTLRWATGRGSTGSAPLDATGRATFSIPAFSGGSYVWAWVDIDGDGEEDLDEEGASGSVYAPGSPAATPTPAPAGPVTQQPIVAPVRPPVAVAPALTFALGHFKSQKLVTVAKSGLAVSGSVSAPATVSFELSLPKRTAKTLHLSKGKTAFRLAHAAVKAKAAGQVKVTLKLSKSTARKLRHHSVTASLTATAVSATGQRTTSVAKVTIKG